ncbi:hypothetical protein AKJ38_01540 [candidate division MSBL1 archaeon SCGC-AAA259I14]|uniref:Uncharacterized protein n=1 Tax=candidate division MSBL1 archaeon SCGC-AAA259I14 TaxID=1698268 RepID=A0A133UST7_9EURY|nr:hypothetical protein AKJ38_01540 [candidate division MSBL1 archaeon SCGC-AAA259I14]
MRIRPGKKFGGQVCSNVFVPLQGLHLEGLSQRMVFLPHPFEIGTPFVKFSPGRKIGKPGGDDVPGTWYGGSGSSRRNRPEKSRKEVRNWK